MGTTGVVPSDASSLVQEREAILHKEIVVTIILSILGPRIDIDF